MQNPSCSPVNDSHNLKTIEVEDLLDYAVLREPICETSTQLRLEKEHNARIISIQFRGNVLRVLFISCKL